MLYQGTNIPLVIEFDENASNLEDICVSLFDKRKNELKHWSKDELVFDGKYVSCAITQDESSDFVCGACTVEIKWLHDGYTKFAVAKDYIVPFDNKCVLGVV